MGVHVANQHSDSMEDGIGRERMGAGRERIGSE